ncbi:MAG: glutamate synthase large subunit, partial [Pseudomonadota bacterium]
NLRNMLQNVEEMFVADPVYLERDYSVDDLLLERVEEALFEKGEESIIIAGEMLHLNNRNKSVGGQLSIDMERKLNHHFSAKLPAIRSDNRGRRSLRPNSVKVFTTGSAGQSYGAFCNDGISLTHTGTCNDGVGKGACGGQITVSAPGMYESENNHHQENVLIGNFALFGATGGRLFVEGAAGDRFAVRNSGATAVVEGVGEFCAEYMTNGTILNIGKYAKGFGNGMSGGFAYQYDPEQQLSNFLSVDSVLSGSFSDRTNISEFHADTVLMLLNWHVEATGSEKAKHILENWEAEQDHFIYIMPKALLQYQDAEAILATKSRKELLDELSTGLATAQVRNLKLAWKSGDPVLGGSVPMYGDVDTEEMFRLVNYWTVLQTSQVIAMKRVGGGAQVNSSEVIKATRNLVLTEDFAVMNDLKKIAQTAIGEYNDQELAVMISNKRLLDFKQALTLRNVTSMDSPSTYSWIIHQDHKNRGLMNEIPTFDSLFANKILPKVTAA